MKQQTLRDCWAKEKGAINAWCSIPSAVTAEMMSMNDFDSITIDMQHGPVSFEAAIPMLQAISTTEVTPLFRAPWNEPSAIMRMLDAGAYGVICPMINNGVEAEELVNACRYPPAGKRSLGPNRARFYGGADYGPDANEEILVFAMIEPTPGLTNLSEILSTPGLDGVYIGPIDLSLSLGGGPGADWTEGPAAEAIDSIIRVTRQHEKVVGIHCGSDSYALSMIKKGCQLVTVQNDLGYLGTQARKITTAVRNGTTINDQKDSSNNIY